MKDCSENNHLHYALINNCHFLRSCTIASKIIVTLKVVYLAISKLHSILAVANLLAHNNISQICYCGQISLQSSAVDCSFSDNLAPLGVTFILLAIVQLKSSILLKIYCTAKYY